MADAKEQIVHVTDASIFFTADRAAEGVIVPLYTPDGKKTDSWIRVLGIDSEKYTQLRDKTRRRLVELKAVPDGAEKDEAVKAVELSYAAGLVIGWNLPGIELTEENAIALFRKAPQLKAKVVLVAEERELFFGLWPQGSSDGQSGTSG